MLLSLSLDNDLPAYLMYMKHTLLLSVVSLFFCAFETQNIFNYSSLLAIGIEPKSPHRGVIRLCSFAQRIIHTYNNPRPMIWH